MSENSRKILIDQMIKEAQNSDNPRFEQILDMLKREKNRAEDATTES